MENVENMIIENNKIKRYKFKTKEGFDTKQFVNQYEPKMLRQINEEIYKLQVEPGDFSFEYLNDKVCYEIMGNNKEDYTECELLISDVTKKHQLKAKINHYDSLVLLGEMASGLAHDLGNQMMIIMNSLELIRANINRAKNLNLLQQTTKNASGLVSSLLTFMRNEKTTKSQIDLGNVVYEAVNLFKQINNRNIKIIFNNLEDNAYVLAEHKALLNVVLNIMINARDAILDNGQILINIKLENLAQLPKNSAIYKNIKGTYYCLSIEDNGCGISREDMAKIFLPFYTTKKHNGNGLGLANAAMIMEENNGIISCESNLNEKTIFKLYLPSLNVYLNPNVLVLSDELAFLNKVKELSNKYSYEFIYLPSLVGREFYQKNFHLIGYVITDNELEVTPETKVLNTNLLNLSESLSNFL